MTLTAAGRVSREVAWNTPSNTNVPSDPSPRMRSSLYLGPHPQPRASARLEYIPLTRLGRSVTYYFLISWVLLCQKRQGCTQHSRDP
eukprot:968477-Prorocentrum_minimum.AAC.1